jgi:hypothetical protein
MSKKLSKTQTKEFLESVPLPNHGGRYTPISHKSIMDTVHAELASHGYEIESELYRSNIIGSVANGIYILKSGDDPELKMMLAWGNSYDKSMRFMCGIGAYVPTTETMVFAGDLSNYMRKHTGNADAEVLAMISTQLKDAQRHYDNICKSKVLLQDRTVTISDASALLGRLFAEVQFLNVEQASAVKYRLVNKIGLISTLPWDNAWNYYMSVTSSLRGSHPKDWFQDHAGTHKFFLDNICTNFVLVAKEPQEGPAATMEIINQLNLLDAIKEAEAEARRTSDDAVILDIILDEQPESLPEHVEEQAAIDNYLESKTVRAEVAPDEDFFNLGKSETFNLPDL